MTDSKTIGAIGVVVAVIAFVIVAVFAISNQPAAQIRVTLDSSGQSDLSVSGVGTVTVAPDVAQLDLGVEVAAKTVAQARAAAADAADSIMASLKTNGVDEKDVKTRYFNIYPQYNRAKEGATEIIGFTVSNQVTVTVTAIDTVSDVLDDAIAAGGDAVRVNGINFTVDEPERYLNEARTKAIDDARAHAEALAGAAGVNVGRVRTISESTSGYYPPEPRMAYESTPGMGGATSISPGERDLIVSVYVVFEID